VILQWMKLRSFRGLSLQWVAVVHLLPDWLANYKNKGDGVRQIQEVPSYFSFNDE
jgi:hypothetical protein